jgi:hypothetical protein
VMVMRLVPSPEGCAVRTAHGVLHLPGLRLDIGPARGRAAKGVPATAPASPAAGTPATGPVPAAAQARAANGAPKAAQPDAAHGGSKTAPASALTTTQTGVRDG